MTPAAPAVTTTAPARRRFPGTRPVAGAAGAVALLAFLVGAAYGAWALPQSVTVADLAGSHPGGDAASFAIARNNLGVAAVMLLVGTATASLGAAAVLLVNGLLIGQLTALLWDGGRMDALVTGLLPHAPLELAGLCAVAAASALPAHAVVGRILLPRPDGPPRALPVRPFALLLALAVGLILAAAWVEGHISHVTMNGAVA
ncbi:stage II sporulation protein M [Clavibacter sp. VKM Ac-2542]|uniref:stage II sporulation protein M n=1 Tax=Clavibacter TaxID=1573 RepID=UPI00188C1082|nr:stage II sporulation protein M [Clavibacter sp. VKM Ac-2542]MBF4620254.1 stage II sporulation protein M [Clavibacter sp. VKM Ac-2542]